MNIKVAAKKNASTTEQGALLEKLSGLFLRARGYEVKENLQNTGAELDLLCTNKTNKAKTIYVECKAYDYKSKTISSEVIWKMKGIKDHKKYNEAWLITTAPLGKQALGVEHEIAEMSDAGDYTFYTPKKLIEVLTDAGLIVEYSYGKKEIIKIVKDEKRLGESLLLITPYGNYWATVYIVSGEPSGVIYTNADDGEIVFDDVLLSKLQTLKSGLEKYDSTVIIELLQSTQEQIENEEIKRLRLNDDYLTEIQDLGVKINHPHTTDFTLEDIYIFPDLEIDTLKKRRKVNSQLLLGNTSRDKYIILGDEFSGKSTLGRLIQWRKSIRNKITVVLNGAEIQNTSPSSIDRYIEKCFKKQFGSSKSIAEIYNKLKKDKTQISLIIDDFDKVSVKKTVKRGDLLDKLDEDYGDIYIFMNSSYELEVLAKGEVKVQLSDYTQARILQLGHVKRDELVAKWLQAGGTDAYSENDILGLKSEILKKIEIAVGENFIPTHPFYILTMLHVFETGTKARTQGSSYADLYHYFIIQALIEANVKPEDMHFYLSYLSYLANDLFVKTLFVIKDTAIFDLYGNFAQEMDIEKDFDSVHRVLLRAKILRKNDDEYSFHLSYSRYYFIARYLANNIDDNDIRIRITELIKNLHQTDASNIVIFLVHHSKNKAIIQEVVNRARELFSEVKMQALVKQELETVNSLITEELKFILKDSSVEESRKQELEKRDAYEDRKESGEGEDDILDVFAQVNLAFKTIDVLGQIADNYYGELDGKSKTEILSELYELGLRGLGGFMQSFEDYTESLRQYLESHYRKDGNNNSIELTQAINKTIYTFMQIVSFAFIKRVSDSVASKNLLHTVDRVIGSRDEPSAKLVQLSARLNFPNELSKQRTNIERLYKSLDKNYLPRDLLKVTVLQHMYKFDVSYQDKQSLCATLGVEYKNLKKSGYLR